VSSSGGLGDNRDLGSNPEGEGIVLSGLASGSGGQPCSVCGVRKADRDGLCGTCRVVAIAKARRRRPEPSPELLADLRKAYTGNSREISGKLKRLSRQCGWPVPCLTSEARIRGWRVVAERHPWTEQDETRLRQYAGSASVQTIARRLRRSVSSVACQARRLELSMRIADGYSIRTLCEVFGVHHLRVEGWIRRGLLGKARHGGQGGMTWFPAASVSRFIRKYPSEYDLGRIDQIWFKAMMFGGLAEFGEKA
jgi:hypothetical protein